MLNAPCGGLKKSKPSKPQTPPMNVGDKDFIGNPVKRRQTEEKNIETVLPEHSGEVDHSTCHLPLNVQLNEVREDETWRTIFPMDKDKLQHHT